MTLPSLAPQGEGVGVNLIGEKVIMQTMGMPEFSYGLFTDTVTWDNWKTAVLSGVNGATDGEIQAAGQFSDYVIKVECQVVMNKDGCCMFLTQPERGGWCLFYNGATMDTYRLQHEQSLDFMNDSFSLGSYQTIY